MKLSELLIVSAIMALICAIALRWENQSAEARIKAMENRISTLETNYVLLNCAVNDHMWLTLHEYSNTVKRAETTLITLDALKCALYASTNRQSYDYNEATNDITMFLQDLVDIK